MTTSTARRATDPSRATPLSISLKSSRRCVFISFHDEKVEGTAVLSSLNLSGLDTNLGVIFYSTKFYWAPLHRDVAKSDYIRSNILTSAGLFDFILFTSFSRDFSLIDHDHIVGPHDSSV